MLWRSGSTLVVSKIAYSVVRISDNVIGIAAASTVVAVSGRSLS